MITMNELVDLRMQQHIAHEIYRQQIMQRIPDPFPSMLPIPMPRHVLMPPRVTLPGVEMTLQNDDLWKQFHQIGTEMIITKSGRRMFPSMRISVAGLEEDSNYCVLLEMVPIGDCRYKFSGSQWVPAGGAEPQSPQRMYLHPDSPASGTHWQAQPILFNKVKLTNNTLDNNGHVVLASMHKYQPRIHVIRTSDLAQIPWAPQQAFVFSETEFVAVTAYQNDRITKLKIDNNPFAKGFRETGQSRCKRKMSSSPSDEDQDHLQTTSTTSTTTTTAMGMATATRTRTRTTSTSTMSSAQNDMSPTKSALTSTTDSASSIYSERANSTLSAMTTTATTTTTTSSATMMTMAATRSAGAAALALRNTTEDAFAFLDDGPQIKRMRSNGSACSLSSLDEVNSSGACASAETNSPLAPAPVPVPAPAAAQLIAQLSCNNRQRPYGGGGGGCGGSNSYIEADTGLATTSSFMHHFQQNMQTLLRPSLVDLACTYFGRPQPIYPQHAQHLYSQQQQQQQQQQQREQHGSGNMHQFGAGPEAQFLQLQPPGCEQNSTMLPLPACMTLPTCISAAQAAAQSNENESTASDELDVGSESSSLHGAELHAETQAQAQAEARTQAQAQEQAPSPSSPPKRTGFSISAILGGGS